MKRQRPKNRTEEKSLTPIRIERAIEIPESRDEVFAYLSNLENNPRWNWAVMATTPLDGPPRRGTKYIQHRAWPRPGSDVLEVTTFEPPRLLAVRGELEEGEVSYHYELTDMTPSRTRLHITLELESAIPERGADLYAARLGATLSTNLEALRAVVTGERLSAAVT